MIEVFPNPKTVQEWDMPPGSAQIKDYGVREYAKLLPEYQLKPFPEIEQRICSVLMEIWRLTSYDSDIFDKDLHSLPGFKETLARKEGRHRKRNGHHSNGKQENDRSSQPTSSRHQKLLGGLPGGNPFAALLKTKQEWGTVLDQSSKIHTGISKEEFLEFAEMARDEATS